MALAAEEGVQLETIAIIRERSGAPHTEILCSACSVFR